PALRPPNCPRLRRLSDAILARRSIRYTSPAADALPPALREFLCCLNRNCRYYFQLLSPYFRNLCYPAPSLSNQTRSVLGTTPLHRLLVRASAASEAHRHQDIP